MHQRSKSLGLDSHSPRQDCLTSTDRAVYDQKECKCNLATNYTMNKATDHRTRYQTYGILTITGLQIPNKTSLLEGTERNI